jgi:enoyl-CoA hydratase
MTDARTGTPPEGEWLGTPYLRFERNGPLAVVTVDRPHAKNAMTQSMYYGVRHAVEHVNRTGDLAGLLITGTGDIFIPGGDLGGVADDDWGGSGHLGLDCLPFDPIRRSAKPVVSAVNGLCQGGGMLIAMLSDVAVASPDATFRSPELFRGIADTIYGQILPRQIGPARARDMLLTGRVVDAPTAVDWGIVSRLATGDVVAEATDALKWACRTAPEARATIKQRFSDFYGDYDRMAMEASLAGPEPIEGFHAFKERRSPAWIPDGLETDGRI